MFDMHSILFGSILMYSTLFFKQTFVTDEVVLLTPALDFVK